jgi:hypothetical protein
VDKAKADDQRHSWWWPAAVALSWRETAMSSLASDGNGGTVVTDPLVGSSEHAALFAAQA